MDERDDDFKELAGRTKAAFEREVEALDVATRQRLAAARRTALEQLDAPARLTPAWVPVGAAAAVAVVAVGVALSLRGPQPAVNQGRDGATELELLLGEDDPALYAEDPEFYAWVEEQTAEGNGDAG